MDAPGNYETIRNVLRAYVEAAYTFPKFCFVDVWLPLERMLHIIKRRKEDGRTIGEVKQLFDEIPDAVTNFDFEIPNKNQKDYPGSVMRVRGSIIVVVNKKVGALKEVITAFERNAQGIKVLQKKKLQESASGETPRS